MVAVEAHIGSSACCPSSSCCRFKESQGTRSSRRIGDVVSFRSSALGTPLAVFRRSAIDTALSRTAAIRCIASEPKPKKAQSDKDESSCHVTRRREFIVSTLLPLLATVEGFGVLQSVGAEDWDEDTKLEKIRMEVTKAVSKLKAAAVLRLAFHDAGTFSLDTLAGGMNGSIIYELDRPESTGLNRPVRVLGKVKTALEPSFTVSWADLIAVAGAESVAICGGPRISVRLGRLDSLSADPEGQMPEETLHATELKNKFQQKGFSTQELVALSGAHTIGNKGFGAPDVFDNSYYKILTQKPWLSMDASQGAMTSMVGLESDRNLTDDNECMMWVNEYAKSQELFFRDFSNAYVKLVNTGAKWT